jgi:hypothetical protein
MDKNVNMTYRFTSDEEPTDEQLLVIMKEVEADVRRENEEIKVQMQINFQQEYKNARLRFQTL